MYLAWLYQNTDTEQAITAVDTLIALAEQSYNEGRIDGYLLRGAYVSKGIVLERIGKNHEALKVYLKVKSILPETPS